MTEKEKMLAGMVYEAVLDEDLKEDRLKCKDLCFAANQLPPSKIKEQSEIFASLFAKAGKTFILPRRSGAIMDIILKLEKISTAITTVSF